MKIVLYFAVLAVLAFEVSTAETEQPEFLSRDKELPIAEGVKLPRLSKPRIVGGQEISQADRKLLKYQVCIIFDNKFLCGGSIISENVIITAGHCPHGMSSAIVFMGAYNKATMFRDGTQSQTISKDNWKIHKDYDDYTLVNDLAVIYLPKKMTFGEFVGSIPIECNPDITHNLESVRISGWGKHSDNNEDTTILRKAEVRTASPDVCSRTFGSSMINNAMICVDATNNVGTCQGDSGGPIVSIVDGKLLGATSFGATGCKQNAPRVFTRLALHRNFIFEASKRTIAACKP